jgi:frataxin
MITRYFLRSFSSITPTFHHFIIRQSSSSASSSPSSDQDLSAVEYDTIVDETLESLTEAFEILLEKHKLPSDVTYASGVLTVELDKYGTYVINKQTPNRQIWLSSPFTGPKRYDFLNQTWIYKHDGMSLHTLLNKELSNVFKNDQNINFKKCSYGETPNDSKK